MPTKLLFNLMCLVIAIVNNCDGFNILLISMPQGSSHRKSMYPLAEAIQSGGHDVTVAWAGVIEDNIRSSILKDERVYLLKANDSEILAFHTGESDILAKVLWTLPNANGLHLFLPWQQFIDYLKFINEQRKNEWKLLGQHQWNHIIVDGLFTPEGIALAQSSSSKYSVMETTMILPFTSFQRGIPYPLAYITQPFSFFHEIKVHPLMDKLLMRANRLFDYVCDIGVAYGVQYLFINHIGLQFTDKFSFTDFYAQAETVFTDYPRALDVARPITNDIIFVGSHCKASNEGLPEHLTQFVTNNSSRGTIYLAFGTVVRWNKAPRKNALAFVAVARRMKSYQFLFQYDGPALNDIPPNMIVQKWFPQLQILNHPRTITFVSHGGLKSLKESLCAGVPLVVMPVFAEQYRNAQLISLKGAGTIIDKLALSSKHVQNEIKKIVENLELYRYNTNKLRIQIRDTPVRGPDLGRFWFEFLVRHNGLPEMYKIRGRHMNFMTYFCIDILSALLATITLVFLTLRVTWTSVYNRYRKY